MSLIEIEAELTRLSAAELRRLALSSWVAFLKKEAGEPIHDECDEDDTRLLAALDEAVRRANSSAGYGTSGDEVRLRIREWTTG